MSSSIYFESIFLFFFILSIALTGTHYFLFSSFHHSCLPCLPGKYSETTGNVQCQICPSGWYQSSSEGTSCNLAKAGSVVAGEGSTTIPVALGWRLSLCNATNQVCSASEPCVAGTTGTDPPSDICEDCLPGKTSSEGALTCQACEPGKFSNAPGGICSRCDISKGEYSTKPESKSCSVCNPDEISTGTKCSSTPVDEGLPIPVISSVLLANDKDWNHIIITWAFDANDSPPPNVAFDLEIFTVGEESNAYFNIKEMSFSFNTSNIDVRRTVVSARVRGALQSEQRIGEWSFRSKPWLSTNGQDCVDDGSYLNTTYSKDPTQWKCDPCPPG